MQNRTEGGRRRSGPRLAVLALALLALTRYGDSIEAQSSCGVSINPIACENQKTGDPESLWDVNGAGDPTLQGFATDISVNVGDTVRFKVSTTAATFGTDIYRLGYYGGFGARKIASLASSTGRNQPACLTDAPTGLVDCGNWTESASWAVPPTAVSGIYVAKLTRFDTGGTSHIVFVVRDDASHSDLLFQTSDTTWQAYNRYGGNSLYTGQPAGRAYKVSYNRPFTTRTDVPVDFLFDSEYPMVRWLEANGYNVSYTTGLDSDRRGSLIPNHKVFLSVGHDEYWSGGQRANVEAARNAGVNLAFFSGNEVFWKTRWETSIDGSGTANRTLVCYKETHANAKIDPTASWTGTWRDPRFSPPGDGGRPENALTGNLFMVNGGGPNPAIQVPPAEGKTRFWRNTTVATVAQQGGTTTLPPETIGFESDVDVDNGSRPPGIFHLSSTTVPITGLLLIDYGSTYSSGVATHTLTLYRHAGGALVFGAGTIRWSWGLDANHDESGPSPSADMKQATVNLLADMGAQPGTLQGGLLPASLSTDLTPPVSTITFPINGQSISIGTPITVTGTATDSGGNVAAVEVSVDSGSTWQQATGRQNWTFAWTPTVAGTKSIMSRAVDDSGNLEQPAPGVSVTIPPQSACPCSIWSAAATPAQISADAMSVEVGVKFRADVDGTVTGIRFYKGAANTGTHTGSLWTITGTRLATATFSSETASGWQQVSFGAPATVTAGTTYVASYHTNVGNYGFTNAYFTPSGVDNVPLHALADGVSGGNGLFLYGASAFPTQSFNAGNYWVDLVFMPGADSTPPTVIGVTPGSGFTGISTATTVTATFSEAINASTLTTNTFVLRDPSNAAVTATVGYNSSTRVATLTPSAALAVSTTYTATLTSGSGGVKDLAGNALASNVTWSFTTAVPDTTPPGVTAVTPANGSGGAHSATAVTATFTEPMNAATFTTSTFVLRDAANAVVAGTVTYNAGTQAATLKPSAALAVSATYTATLTGGASGVKDLAGNALASNFVWSFTTGATLGLTTIGSIADSGDSNYLNGSKVTTPSAGAQVSSMSVYVDSIDSLVANQSYQLAIYDDGAGQPGALVATSLAGTLVANTWNTVAITATLQPSHAYWLMYNTNGRTASVNNMRFNNGSAGQGVYSNPPVSFGTWPAAFPSPTVTSSVCSLYLTYAPPADTTPPTVTAVTPANGATGVSSATTATATFSEAINAATLTTSTFVLRDPGNNVVAGTVGYNAATRVATLTPSSALAASATYTATMIGGSSGVKDTAGNALASNFVWSFTTAVPDTTPPAVTGVTPAAGATGVSTATAVTATFSEAINVSTLTTSTFVLRDPGNNIVAATVAYNAATRVGTLTPSATLGTSTTYTATVTGGSSGVKDLAGNALASNFIWSFTTTIPDTTPPTVTGVTPANGATAVSTGTAVTATFSEAMNAATITASTFVLRDPANAIVASAVSYNAATRVVTLTPSAALGPSKTYTATLTGGTSGVKDLAGNALASNFAWSFTTTAAAPIGLTTIGSNVDEGDSNFMNGSRVTTSIAGQITSMSVYMTAIDPVAANRQYQLAIYTDSAGRPGTLVAASATGTLVANAWNTLAVTASLQAGTSYWLMFNTNGQSPLVNNMSYNTGAAGQGGYSNAQVTFGTWPATFPAVTLTNGVFSLYATFVP